MNLPLIAACFRCHFSANQQMLSEISGLTRISHQEIWLWARRHENGGGNVPVYLEYTIFGTTHPPQADNFAVFDRVFLKKVNIEF